jgi:gliding motility-associated-like protein
LILKYIKIFAMRFFYLKSLLFLALILMGEMTFAQPLNDNCATATQINVKNSNFCSNDAQFTNVGATVSPLGTNRCLSANGLDVWFSFVSIATDVKVTVIGRTATQPAGTMARPEIGLYTTSDCSTFNDLVNCDASTNGLATVERAGLIPGERYYIRVQGGAGTTGTFKLCIQNYNPPVDPSGDCSKASILCDKSPFSLRGIQGGGSDPTELNVVPCRWTDGCVSISRNENAENNTLWFKWTCATSGTLEFVLTPTKADLDIDFVVFKLPNGPSNCQNKEVLRCMFSGDDTSPKSPCYGATGLRAGESDVSEPTACRCVTHNNFLKPLDMVAGETYALAIDIPYASKEGFSVNWGGTGTFQGPVAKINVNKPDKKYCLGEDVLFTDASSFVGGQIVKRQWRFGKDASQDSASSAGPNSYSVFYKTPGWKSVVLTVTSDKGCVVTSIVDSILIEGFKYDSLLRRPTCELGTDGLIRLRVISCGRPPIRYNWDNTGYSARDSLAGLSSGRHFVLVTDSSGMHVDTFSFNLKQFDVELDKSSIVTPPTCFGLSNGKIDLKPATGIAPFLYKWNNSPTFLPDNTLTSLSEGQYSVEIRDANNCKGIYTFNVAAPLPVSVAVDSFNITCFGLTDGAAIAYPAGGVGKYKVTWSTGTVGDTVRNLKAGTYSLIARDSNACETTRNITIIEPGQIGLAPLRIQPAKCFGDSTAELVVLGSGGTPPFRYSIDGIRFQRDSAFFKIPSKTYTVVVRDSTGCRRTIDVDVPQPPQIQVTAGADITVQLGFSTDIRATVIPSTKLVSYAWTPKDSTMACATCPRTSVGPFNTTKYRVTVKDSSGCTAFDELIVNVDKKRPIFIPTAFSPNGDGINDYFTAFGNQSAVIIKELRVFNRWGDMLYVGKDLPLNNESKGWDGTFNDTKLNPDVFAFFAVIRFIDGEEIVYKGDITLLK